MMHPLDQEIEATRKQILALEREKTQIQIHA
ncbi:hypothetical protein AmaxDRAFT_2735 [Limnospira maxima CS-328]|uniref:Uncharacterized protein n=1 Tax=Limnospira maxima CS-328 TaxID=513049 RepID=B5W1T7_LIMMA|nr:hypothetical protein AmaxDRAFT_2735 [Limnospira maxima CS-328]